MVDVPALIDEELSRVLTQYRESPKLLHLIKTMLSQVGQVVEAVDAVPTFFDLDQASGHQLTILGQALGFPRCHCVCTVQPLFGFGCEGIPSIYTLAGLCDPASTWINCGPFGSSDICLNDDEVYRAFLKVRRYQVLSLYDLASLLEAVQTLWGETATVLDSGQGRVVVAPGRDLTLPEQALMQIYPRVLPVAPGISIRFHLLANTKVFGFGEGWGGFCEPLYPEGLPLSVGNGTLLVTEDGTPIGTGPLTQDAPWMCETVIDPYACVA